MRDVTSDPRAGDRLVFPTRNHRIKVSEVSDGDVWYLLYVGPETEGKCYRCDRSMWAASIGEAIVKDQVEVKTGGEDGG